MDDERIYAEIPSWELGWEFGRRSCEHNARHVFTVLGSLSILCLLAIILLYSLFAQLRVNLHGKIVLSCAFSTLFATLFLVIVYNHNFKLRAKGKRENGTLTQANDHNMTHDNAIENGTLGNGTLGNGTQGNDHNMTHENARHGNWKEQFKEQFNQDCFNNTIWNISCINKLDPTNTCAIVGHLGLFANLAMFSWMTVMCFNLLRMFRRMEPRILNTNYRRFVAYSIFGWGFPFLVTVLALAAKVVFREDSPFNPLIGIPNQFGKTRCFIDDEDPRRQLIFFYLPMCFLLLLNLIGFIFCVINLKANSRGISSRRKRLQSAFAKLSMSREARIQMLLNIKLFLVFGFLWCFEAFHVGLEYLIGSNNHPGPNSPRSHLQEEEEEEERFCDSPLRIFSWVVGSINFLRGLFLFVTFCCKKQVWDLVTRSCRRKRPTMTMTGRNIKDESSKIKEEGHNSDEGMLKVKDNLAASASKEAKDQCAGDHFESQHPDLPEKSINNEGEDEVENQGTSREIPNSRAVAENLEEVASTGDSQSVTTPENCEHSIKTEQNTSDATLAHNHHVVPKNDMEVSPVTVKKKRQNRSKSTRWTTRFSTSPSEWGSGWVQSLRQRMEAGK